MTTIMTAAVDSKTSLTKALAAIKRERPPLATLVWNHNPKSRSLDRDLPVIHVPDDVVLTLIVYSGLPFLKLGSGRLLYVAYSAWGNSLEVLGGHAHVHTENGVKVTVTIEEGDGRVTTDVGGNNEYNRLRMYDMNNRTRPPITEVETGPQDVPGMWQSAR